MSSSTGGTGTLRTVNYNADRVPAQKMDALARPEMYRGASGRGAFVLDVV